MRASPPQLRSRSQVWPSHKKKFTVLLGMEDGGGEGLREVSLFKTIWGSYLEQWLSVCALNDKWGFQLCHNSLFAEDSWTCLTLGNGIPRDLSRNEQKCPLKRLPLSKTSFLSARRLLKGFPPLNFHCVCHLPSNMLRVQFCILKMPEMAVIQH